MSVPNYIVFQCYGYDRVFHECAYALLSVSRLYPSGLPGSTTICIYTDKPERFRELGSSLPLEFRTMDRDIIAKWRGSINFVHRVKIEILLDFTAKHSGNILYADTDVVFTWPPEKMFEDISAGKLYMHIREGKVSDAGNPIFRKLNNYLSSKQLMLNGSLLHEMDMWNAGVLGFNTNQKTLLDDVLSFTDLHYPRFPKHVVEQFAFSAYLQSAADVKAAAPFIFHYWNLKEAGDVLASFFAHYHGRPWAELVRCSSLVQIPVLMQEKVVFLSNRSFTGTLAGKKWAPAIPDWQQAEKQL